MRGHSAVKPQTIAASKDRVLDILRTVHETDPTQNLATLFRKAFCGVDYTLFKAEE